MKLTDIDKTNRKSLNNPSRGDSGTNRLQDLWIVATSKFHIRESTGEHLVIEISRWYLYHLRSPAFARYSLKFNHALELFAKSGSTSFRCCWFSDEGRRLEGRHITPSFSFSTTRDANTWEGEIAPQRDLSLSSLHLEHGLYLSPFSFSFSPSFSPSFSSVSILWQPTGRKRDRWLGDVCMMPGAIRQSWTLASVRDDYLVNRRVCSINTI